MRRSQVHAPAIMGLGVLFVVVGLWPALGGDAPAEAPVAAAVTEPATSTSEPVSQRRSEPELTPTPEPTPTPTPEPTPTPAPAMEPTVSEAEVAAFYDVFTDAVRAGDAATLAGLLHPLVFDRYGEDQCDTYLEGVVDDSFEAEVLASGSPAPWDWELDGVTTTVPDAVAVQLRISSNGGSAEQEAHLALVGGELRWFTDCGEPAD